jgi:hypothetical protein
MPEAKAFVPTPIRAVPLGCHPIVVFLETFQALPGLFQVHLDAAFMAQAQLSGDIEAFLGVIAAQGMCIHSGFLPGWPIRNKESPESFTVAINISVIIFHYYTGFTYDTDVFSLLSFLGQVPELDEFIQDGFINLLKTRKDFPLILKRRVEISFRT